MEKNITRILASGMITSEFGLCHLEHTAAPAGINELHDSMKEVIIKEVSDIPFVFIRGVKLASESFKETDIMRGEETELMGIMTQNIEESIYILPGSHSKIIEIDDLGRICHFSTMLTGEMIEALSQNTILKDAVDLNTDSINTKYLLKGFDFSIDEGIGKALFKTRILKNVFGCTSEETYSFFIGAVLAGEIKSIIKSGAKNVVIGGQSRIKNAIALILGARCDKNIIVLDEDTVKYSTVIGAIRIYEGI